MLKYLTTDEILAAFTGVTPVDKLYHGSNLIYSRVPPPEFDYLAPSDLVASTFSTTEIGLTWVNNSVNAEGVSIERREEATAFAEIDTILPDVESYLDDTCIEGTKYYYRLRAFMGVEYSDYSNTGSATTILLAPSLLTATTFSATRIDLAWTVNSTNRDGHSIERSPDNSTWSQIDTVLNAIATYPDITCVANTLYYYRVRAYKGAVYSTYSNTASATTYCTEAAALFVRMDVQPSTALKVLINKTIVDLKAASLWTTCHDLLYFFNLHTEQASLLNWVNTSYNATKVGSPTFTPKIGINMPSNNNHLTSNYNPATDASNFLQDSGSMGFWLYDCSAANNSYACGSASNLRIMFRTGDTLSYVNATSSLATTPTLIGLTDVDHLVSRTASNVTRAFRYGLFVNQSTVASGAITSGWYYIGRGAVTVVGIATHRQHNLSRGMTDDETLTFHNILKYFNDNVGGTF